MAGRIRTRAIIALASLAFSLGAARAEYPDRPIHFIVAFPPGGASDALARIIGQKLTEEWHQTVIVENRPGAGGSIAADFVARAPADGYTIAIVSNAHTTTPLQYQVNYDPVKSFTPVTSIAYVPSFLIVNPQLPISSFQDLISYARAHPGKLNYATAGADYLQWRLLKNAAGIDMVNVPYDGGGAAQTAVISGEVQMTLAGGAAAVGLVKTGKVKALAVTGNARSPLLPDVPTVAEAAPDLRAFIQGTEAGTWFGALAPAHTPPEIVGKLRDEIAAVVKMPDVRDKLAAQAFVPVADTPQDFAATIQKDLTRWAAVQALK